MRDGVVFHGDIEDDDDYVGFKRSETICMEYKIWNGNKCKLSFYNESKDDELLHEVALPNDKDITS